MMMMPGQCQWRMRPNLIRKNYPGLPSPGVTTLSQALEKSA